MVHCALAVQMNSIISVKPCMNTCYIYSPVTLMLCLFGMYPNVPTCITFAGAATIACMRRCDYSTNYNTNYNSTM